jgi:hypothetical protein
MKWGVCALIDAHSSGARILSDVYYPLSIEDCDKFGCLLHEPITPETETT